MSNRHEPSDTPSPPRPSWTAERTERLLSLWRQRVSSARIAAELGPGFTRNAVVGKLFRLGLKRTDEQRQADQAAGARRGRGRRGWSLRAGPPRLPVEPLPPPTPCAVAPKLTPLEALTACVCRWPYEVGDDILFCGWARMGAKPYCPEHAAIAYEAAPPPLTFEEIEASLKPGRRIG